MDERDAAPPGADTTDGLFAIARALRECAIWLKYLGGGENTDSRGAVEFLATSVGDPLDRIATALEIENRAWKESDD